MSSVDLFIDTAVMMTMKTKTNTFSLSRSFSLSLCLSVIFISLHFSKLTNEKENDRVYVKNATEANRETFALHACVHRLKDSLFEQTMWSCVKDDQFFKHTHIPSIQIILH